MRAEEAGEVFGWLVRRVGRRRGRLHGCRGNPEAPNAVRALAYAHVFAHVSMRLGARAERGERVALEVGARATRGEKPLVLSLSLALSLSR